MRDIIVGLVKDDQVKLILGEIGILLTFVGPEADGPYSAFKAGVKLIASVPTVGPKAALKAAKSVLDALPKRLPSYSEGAGAFVLSPRIHSRHGRRNSTHWRHILA